MGPGPNSGNWHPDGVSRMKPVFSLISCVLATAPAVAQDVFLGDDNDHWLGWSVDVEGNTAFASAPQLATPTVGGSVRIYDYSNFSWSQQDTLASTDPLEEFGWAIDASGNWLAVGAPGVSDGSGPLGRVYLYENVNGRWTLRQTVETDQSGDRFGESLALAGDTLMVGAYLRDTAITDAGAVLVYRLSGNTWSQTQTLEHPYPGSQDYFGFALDHDGQFGAVGAYQGDVGLPGTGEAFAFFLHQGQWVFYQSLAPEDSKANGFFGRSISVEGSCILVGSHDRTDFYEPVNGWLARTGTASLGPSFGYSVDLVDGQAVIGQPTETLFGTCHVLRGADLVEGNSFIGPGSQFRNFGNSVAGNQDWIVSGGFRSHGDRGGVAIYRFNDVVPEFVEEFCACVGSPCGDSPYAGCVNSTGNGAHLEWAGTTRVSLDDGVLRLTDLPVSQIGMVLMGTSETMITVGDGQLCVAGGPEGSFRFPVYGTGFGQIDLGPGMVQWTNDNFTPGGRLKAGSTWNFQAWYRDPQSTCGATSNLTNAVSVTFRP